VHSGEQEREVVPSRRSARPFSRIPRRSSAGSRSRPTPTCCHVSARGERARVGVAHRAGATYCPGMPMSASRSFVPMSTRSTPSTAAISSRARSRRRLELHHDHGRLVHRAFSSAAGNERNAGAAASCGGALPERRYSPRNHLARLRGGSDVRPITPALRVERAATRARARCSARATKGAMD